ncbi:anthranilate synthase component I, partial [Geobacillus stearothermophilus]|nr:anthranilate synthase component I [Geobacillus stearothermophilus]
MSIDRLAAFLADARQFRTIPIMRKFLADVIEPLQVFANLREEAVFLLESKDDESPWARYSFIGVAPFLTLESETGETFLIKDENGNVQMTASTLKEAFQAVERALCVKPLAEAAPFTGGAVGFLGYDFISAIEKVPRHRAPDLAMKAGHFVFCESLFAFDHEKRELSLIHYIRLKGHETMQEKIAIYRAAEERIAALAAKAARPRAEQ